MISKGGQFDPSAPGTTGFICGNSLSFHRVTEFILESSTPVTRVPFLETTCHMRRPLKEVLDFHGPNNFLQELSTPGSVMLANLSSEIASYM